MHQSDKYRGTVGRMGLLLGGAFPTTIGSAKGYTFSNSRRMDRQRELLHVINLMLREEGIC
jgi:hypothetical protein